MKTTFLLHQIDINIIIGICIVFSPEVEEEEKNPAYGRH